MLGLPGEAGQGKELEQGADWKRRFKWPVFRNS